MEKITQKRCKLFGENLKCAFKLTAYFRWRRAYACLPMKEGTWMCEWKLHVETGPSIKYKCPKWLKKFIKKYLFYQKALERKKLKKIIFLD